MITQLINLTWFLGSESFADLKAKTKIGTPRSSPGTGLPSPGLDDAVSVDYWLVLVDSRRLLTRVSMEMEVTG